MKKYLIALLLAGSASAQPVRDGKLVINSTAGAEATAISVVSQDGKSTLLRQEKGNLLLDPSWAPDGGIFYVHADRAGKSSELCWMSAQGTDSRVVRKFPTGVAFQPTPSPDGKHMIFYLVETEKGEELPQIWLADGDGSNPHPVGPKGACFPAWSGDSREFLAVIGTDDRARRAELVAYDLDGQALRTVFSSPDTFVTPAWTPDGKSVVLARMPEGAKLSHLYRLDLDSKELRQLTQGEDGAEMSAYFDAEGRLYYNRITKATISVWSCDADGKNARQVVDHAALHGGASLLWLNGR